MKRCFKCKSLRPFEEFYKHPQMADGFLGKCKQCTKQDVALNRNKNIDRVRHYDRLRGGLDHRKNANRERAKAIRRSGDTEAIQRLNEANRRYSAKHADRRKAQIAVGNAIRDGRLIRGLCFVCGSEKVEGHHYDYSKPLDVVWVCRQHHCDIHKGKILIKRK